MHAVSRSCDLVRTRVVPAPPDSRAPIVSTGGQPSLPPTHRHRGRRSGGGETASITYSGQTTTTAGRPSVGRIPCRGVGGPRWAWVGVPPRGSPCRLSRSGALPAVAFGRLPLRTDRCDEGTGRPRHARQPARVVTPPPPRPAILAAFGVTRQHTTARQPHARAATRTVVLKKIQTLAATGGQPPRWLAALANGGQTGRVCPVRPRGNRCGAQGRPPMTVTYRSWRGGWPLLGRRPRVWHA